GRARRAGRHRARLLGGPQLEKGQTMPGLLRGVARTALGGGTATAAPTRVSRRQANRWASQDQQSYEEQPYQQQQASAAPPPAPADDMDTKIAQLKELGELKSQGGVSGGECAAQKQRI